MNNFSLKATNNKNRRIMKKQYFAPEMEIVDINVNQQLLAGSTPVLGGDLEGGDPILAPEMDDELGLFGLDPLNGFGL